ncbi:hypothetical protein ACFSTC_25930 [Nonomuraea ferruginea]
MIHELASLAGLRAACGDDDLVVWNAQDLGGGGSARAWASGGAVVSAAPGVSRHDRLAVWGRPPTRWSWSGTRWPSWGPPTGRGVSGSCWRRSWRSWTGWRWAARSPG